MEKLSFSEVKVGGMEVGKVGAVGPLFPGLFSSPEKSELTSVILLLWLLGVGW